MQKQSAFVFFALCMVPGYAIAQQTETSPPPMSLEQQERLEAKQKFSDALAPLVTALVEGAKDKQTKCIKAFGNTKFCECIADHTPTGVDFLGYVSITAGTKEDFKYDQLSPDDKGLFDATRRARDECVADPESWKKATNSSPAD